MISDDPSIIKPTLAHLKSTFTSGKTLDITYRKSQLRSLIQGLKDLEPKFHKALDLDLHNCETFSQMCGVGLCIDQVTLCLKELDKWVKPTPVDTPAFMSPAKSYIQPEPYGVVLILGPWNYPVILTISYMAAAIAAGNCVIIKPSEFSVHNSNAMAELVEKYLDKDAYRCIEGAGEVAKAITKEPFDKIMFTGGTEKGKLVAKAAAENLVPCILELGGKCPTIVNKDADLENAALKIARAKLLNTGQTCLACDYLFVHKDVKDKFLEMYREKVVQFYGQDAAQSRDYGRIINVDHTKRLKGYIEDNHGGKLVMGGQVNVEEKYVSPTVIDSPKPDSKVMQDEIFGPILPVYGFTDIGEVIKFVNDKPKPLALYYYGSVKTEDFKQIKLRTSSGALATNESFMQIGNRFLPFGGVGASGYGTTQGYYGFKAFSHMKPVMECNMNNRFPASALFPPFTDTTRKLLSFSSKYLQFKQSQLGYAVVVILVLLVVGLLLRFMVGSASGAGHAVRDTLDNLGRKDL